MKKHNGFFVCLDGPSFQTTPKSVSEDAGVKVTLVCLVDGNPEPKYTWFRNGDMQTVCISSNLKEQFFKDLYFHKPQ